MTNTGRLVRSGNMSVGVSLAQAGPIVIIIITSSIIINIIKKTK